MASALPDCPVPGRPRIALVEEIFDLCEDAADLDHAWTQLSSTRQRVGGFNSEELALAGQYRSVDASCPLKCLRHFDAMG